MNAMAPTRPTELYQRRVRLTREPAAAAEARSQVRATIRDWKVPVDPDIAILLTSDLVTNVITHGDGETVTLAIRCSRGHLRIDAYDKSRYLPGGRANQSMRGPDTDWCWLLPCRPNGVRSAPRRARPCTSRSRSSPIRPPGDRTAAGD